jgi:hypothetical protein
VVGLAVIVCTVGTALSAGCTTSSLFRNFVAPVTGDVTFVLINDTPYRAVFSFGTYNDLDRSPGVVNLQQLRLEAHTSGELTTLACAHNAAVGTDGLVARVLATNADETAEFDAEAFHEWVGFSSFPSDSAGAGLADAGSAEGLEVLLGVDFSCGDQLIFTFVEDETATGGFRIDFAVLVSEE